MSSQPSSSAPLSFLDQEMLFLNQPDGTPPASPSLTGTFSALTPQNAFSATLSGTQNNSPVYPYHAMMYPPQMLAQLNYSQQSTFPQTPLPPSMLQTIPSYYSGNILFPQAHNLPSSLGVFNPNGPATNAVSTQPPTKRKRQTTTSSGRSGKRQKKNSAAVVTEITPSPHCSVGPPSVVPSAQAEVVHQTSNCEFKIIFGRYMNMNFLCYSGSQWMYSRLKHLLFRVSASSRQAKRHFSYKTERLSFVEELAREADYAIVGPLTEHAIDELLKAGNLEELEDLVKNIHDQL
ncbi:hypothetical protein CPB84DRAFT_1853444 [Gymnopilus junonius]|uniref:Uncharacterized protein n=1 Tax=Gymnopilus junonius TaxID=109634 RepID=A0A9P5NA81_GYMJU|nr:hypothetical protein CPB84DRAFT_1853444 [Gymnopilus junonius]